MKIAIIGSGISVLFSSLILKSNFGDSVDITKLEDESKLSISMVSKL